MPLDMTAATDPAAIQAEIVRLQALLMASGLAGPTETKPARKPRARKPKAIKLPELATVRVTFADGVVMHTNATHAFEDGTVDTSGAVAFATACRRGRAAGWSGSEPAGDGWQWVRTEKGMRLRAVVDVPAVESVYVLTNAEQDALRAPHRAESAAFAIIASHATLGREVDGDAVRAACFAVGTDEVTDYSPMTIRQLASLYSNGELFFGKWREDAEGEWAFVVTATREAAHTVLGRSTALAAPAANADDADERVTFGAQLMHHAAPLCPLDPAGYDDDANSDAASEPARDTSEILAVRTVYGTIVRVRRSDLDGVRKILPCYDRRGGRKAGNAGKVHRSNLDLDGTATRPDYSGMRVICARHPSRDEPFATEAGARRALRRYGLDPAGYELREWRGGYVAVRLDTSSAPAESVGAELVHHAAPLCPLDPAGYDDDANPDAAPDMSRWQCFAARHGMLAENVAGPLSVLSRRYLARRDRAARMGTIAAAAPDPAESRTVGGTPVPAGEGPGPGRYVPPSPMGRAPARRGNLRPAGQRETCGLGVSRRYAADDVVRQVTGDDVAALLAALVSRGAVHSGCGPGGG